MKMDKLDQEILKFIQADLPLTSNPFQGLANSLNITEKEIINRIQTWQDQGIVRRFGAILRHQKAGYDNNAMVAWMVDETEADKAGQIMAGHPNISHCYLRDVPSDFAYALFTMIHARSEKELEEIISNISKETEIKDFTILKSMQELKKTSMQYVK